MWAWVGVALLLCVVWTSGYVMGRLMRRAEAPQMVDDWERAEKAARAWKPRMRPETYLRLHPDGPYAEQARLIVANHSMEA